MFSALFVAAAMVKISGMTPDETVKIGGQAMGQKQLYTLLLVGTLKCIYGLLCAGALPLMWLSSAGSAIFWVLGASGKNFTFRLND